MSIPNRIDPNAWVMIRYEAPNFDGGGSKREVNSVTGLYTSHDEVEVDVKQKKFDCGRGEGCCWKARQVKTVGEELLGFLIDHLVTNGNPVVVITEDMDLTLDDDLPANWLVIVRS